jgi:hypothetical protein
MKQFATGVLVLGLLFSATPALAANTIAGCSVPPDHGIYNESNELVGCIKAEAWNKAMTDYSHTIIGALPTFAAGESVTDEHGVMYECPVWFGFFRCVDATKTPEYRAYMQDMARDLIARGWSAQFPVFAEWVASVR